jgi:hypothetical protein
MGNNLETKREGAMPSTSKTLTLLEFTDADHKIARGMAEKLGFAGA